jgi:RND superfamily putative drug exporter
MGFAKLGLFSKAGPALAIGIAVALLAALTLLPAIMMVVAPRGWIDPRPERTAIFWRRMGVRIVRRPKLYLAASVAILLALASCASLLRYNYDDRKQLPASAASSKGYAALDRHFPVNQTIPEYLFIQSPQDLRTPRALADLEQMALRVSQIPGIAMVRGVTRPTGESLEQAKATYQAGQVGSQLSGASEQINGRTDDLNRLASGADKLADTLGDIRGQIKQAMGSVSSLVDALSYIQNQFGGDTTFADIDKAAKLLDGIKQLAAALQVNFAAATSNFEWIDPVVFALDTSLFCDTNPICAAARVQFHRLQTARDDGTLEAVAGMLRQLQASAPLQKLSDSVGGLSRSLKTISASLKKLGLSNSGNAKTQLITLQNGANDLASASRQVSDGVQVLVEETKRMGIGLNEASSFLMSMGQDASNPSMAGFNIPTQILNSDDFKRVARAFISPDGHSVRYFVQTDLNPFSTQAMDQINKIIDVAKGAQPNTTLADAKVAMSGYPVTLRDTRDYYDRDIRLIALITVAVVLLILTLLLRAIIAPLYLVGTVILSCLSAVGVGVVVFQLILGQQLHWSVPGFAFVVLVAVGADYNMLLASRLRDESARGIRTGVIRTVRSTGGVITAAGLIFTASMSGLLFSSIGTVVQSGFVIGVGIMLDTFLVRTITVPAIATLLGRLSWWPARPWLEQREPEDGPGRKRPTVFDSV